MPQEKGRFKKGVHSEGDEMMEITSKMVMYAVGGLALYGYVAPASVTQTAKITNPQNGALIGVQSFPYNLRVSGSRTSGLVGVQVRIEETGWITASLSPNAWSASIPIPAPGPRTVQMSATDAAGNTLIASISIELRLDEIIDGIDWTQMIGVNYWLDPVFSRRQGAAPRPADPNFVRTWWDRIAALKIKVVRIPILWEAMYPYADNQDNVINQLIEIAAYCEAKKIYTYPCFFKHPPGQGASAWGGENAGFPSYMVNGYLANPSGFFEALYSNSVNGVPDAWGEIFTRFWQPILEKIDNYRYVLGYELMNEPPVYTTTQIAGLGNFHTAMAEKIRNWGSQKHILYIQGFPQGGGFWTNQNNVDIAPRVSDIVYCPHNYAGVNPLGWKERFTTRMNSFDAIKTALDCPVLVDEFGIGLRDAPLSILTQDNMDHIFNEMKRLGFGGCCWAYTNTVAELHRMVTAAGDLTTYGQLYMNARKKVYGY